MLKHRRRKPNEAKLKVKRKKKGKVHYFYSMCRNYGCDVCGSYTQFYYVISGRPILCEDCFKEKFQIEGIAKVSERIKGIAEALNKKWLKAFKKQGGHFVSWNQKLETWKRNE